MFIALLEKSKVNRAHPEFKVRGDIQRARGSPRTGESACGRVGTYLSVRAAASEPSGGGRASPAATPPSAPASLVDILF